jgi:glycerophosphoryl diester phosphodiesterase
VAVIAFSQTVVGEIRNLEPKMTCPWICGSIPTEAKANTVTQQADWLHAQARACEATILDLNHAMLSPLIAELERRGLGVWCWTVNEPVVMKARHQWGVDSITTDHPDQLHQSIN